MSSIRVITSTATTNSISEELVFLISTAARDLKVSLNDPRAIFMRSYLSLFIDYRDDNKIEQELEKFKALALPEALILMFQCHWHISKDELQKAQQIHDTILSQPLSDSNKKFIKEILICALTYKSWATRNPNALFQTLKLKASITTSSADISAMLNAKRLLADNSASQEMQFNARIGMNPPLLLKNLSEIHQSLLGLLNSDEFKLNRDPASPAETKETKDSGSSSVLIELNGPSLAPELSEAKKEEFRVLIKIKQERLKALGLLNSLLEEFPGTEWAYTLRANVRNSLNPFKYRHLIDQDLKIALQLNQKSKSLGDFRAWNLVNIEMHFNRNEIPEAKHCHEANLNTPEFKTEQEILKKGFMSSLDDHYQQVSISSRASSYELFKLKSSLSQNRLNKAIVRKIDEMFDFMNGIDEMLLNECKGYALSVFPNFGSMSSQELHKYQASPQEAKRILAKVCDLSYAASLHLLQFQGLEIIDDVAKINTDFIIEILARMTQIRKKKLAEKCDTFINACVDVIRNTVSHHGIRPEEALQIATLYNNQCLDLYHQMDKHLHELEEAASQKQQAQSQSNNTKDDNQAKPAEVPAQTPPVAACTHNETKSPPKNNTSSAVIAPKQAPKASSATPAPTPQDSEGVWSTVHNDRRQRNQSSATSFKDRPHKGRSTTTLFQPPIAPKSQNPASHSKKNPNSTSTSTNISAYNYLKPKRIATKLSASAPTFVPQNHEQDLEPEDRIDVELKSNQTNEYNNSFVDPNTFFYQPVIDPFIAQSIYIQSLEQQNFVLKQMLASQTSSLTQEPPVSAETLANRKLS